MKNSQLCVAARLEARRLLAFAEVGGDGDTLIITGTAGPDVIDIAVNDSTGNVEATLNGEVLAFDLDAVIIGSVNVDCGGGNDVVTSRVAVRSIVNGGEGDDSITAVRGNDVLSGDGGDDTLDGGSGPDRLVGGPGADRIMGRAGEDTIDVLDSDADALIDGGTGLDEVTFLGSPANLVISLDGVDNDTVAGQPVVVRSIDILVGGDGDDLLTGNSGNNRLNGGPGADTLRGLGGDDELGDLTTSNDLIDAGSGDDLIVSGSSTVFGRGGDDTINDVSGSGPSTLDGGSGNDTIFIRNEPSSAFAGAGDDVLAIEVSDPTVFTIPSTLSGGSGQDRLRLETFGVPQGFSITTDDFANDGLAGTQLSINVARDLEGIEASALADFIDVSASAHGMDVITGFGEDTITGSAFSDTITGGGGNDSIDGGSGEDVLRGGEGRDTITGGPGADSFNGGPDADLMKAADGEADVVNGAQSLIDSAEVDDLLDTLIRVERTM